MTGVQFVVEETLYLTAVRVLARLESEREEKFAIHTATDAYLEEPVVHERFKAATGREFKHERGTVRLFISGAYYPTHYSEPLGHWKIARDELYEPAADAVRTIGWALLTAWTQRYGGLCGELVDRWSLVDPKRLEPQAPS